MKSRSASNAFAVILLVLSVILAFSATHSVQAQETDAAAGEAAAESPAGTLEPEQEQPAKPHSVLVDPEIDPAELELRLVPLTREELSLLADEWLEIVRIKTEEVMAEQITVAKLDGGIEEAMREDLANLVFERNALFDRFSQVLTSWEHKAGTSEEDIAKIAEYRAYRDAVMLDELRTSELQTLYAEALRWLTDFDGGIGLAIDAGIAIIAILVLVFIAALIRRGVDKALSRFDQLTNLMQGFLAHCVFWLVLASGAIVALSLMGTDITPLFALIGAASFILAFAFQETLGNLASGFMIIVNRPFDEGDTVDIGGVTGVVHSVSLVATKIVTFDNQIILVPNRNVWGNVIKNLTASSTRRVDLVFGIGYQDSIEQAAEVLRDVVLAHKAVLPSPEPVIRVHELADSSVNFICRPWTRTEDYWSVYWDLTQQVKLAFDEQGISIPFPQRDVHLYSEVSPEVE